ncbi:hypothetical protein JZ751_008769 [Albula glossodonta]|uniref:Uncharacterized protein n=1 Tax=Albula glossodonta TaxID=121402 RepID=A0A8T2NZ53_9TELE|nr:hypothetical protein JZ751_008769 [Albula glossodonta]
MSLAQQSTVMESWSRAELSLPSRIPASMAAPTGMTSSGGMELRSSTSGKRSWIICCSFGILAEPPHSTTWWGDRQTCEWNVAFSLFKLCCEILCQGLCETVPSNAVVSVRGQNAVHPAVHLHHRHREGRPSKLIHQYVAVERKGGLDTHFHT